MITSEQILAGLKWHDEVHGKALDWLIISWGKKGYDKQIAFLYYKKYSEQAAEIAKKISEIK